MSKKDKFLDYIIDKIDTKTSRTDGTTGYKNFQVTQNLIDKFGRREIIDSLVRLEQTLSSEIIQVKWKYSGREIVDVSSFKIKKESIETLFQIAGRSSSRCELEKALDRVNYQMSLCSAEWLKEGFYKDSQKQISRGTVPVLFKEDNITFFKVLNDIVSNDSYYYERAYSTKFFADSKRFEREYKSQICSILRRYWPDYDSDVAMSDNDLLRQFKILTYNNTFEFKGPLVYRINGTDFSTENLSTGVVFNTNTLIDARIESVSGVKKIVTVENKANYYLAKYEPDTIIIYVHGFMSPLELAICRQIIDKAEGAKIYHWSDLDYGGIRIFKYLKDHLSPSIIPLHMDLEAYAKYEANCEGYKIKESVRKKLESMDAGELEPLRLKLLETGIAFEQEEMLLWE